ncbi:hypothetical protein AB0900_31340 [Streptomyces cellulosae]
MNKQTLRTTATHTLANITYYGGTIGAGIAFYNLMNKPSNLGFIAVIVVILTVEGILRTLVNEFLDAVIPEDTTPAADVVSLPKETSR